MFYYCKKLVLVATLAASFFLFSCTSVAKIAVNTVSDTLAGSNSKGVSAKQKSSDINPMLPLTGETDTILMQDFFPTALKMYEIVLSQNPKHQGLGIMTGSLYVMYANAFVQHRAELLPLEQYDQQDQEFMRAKKHYLRGRDYVLSALDVKYPGFAKNITSGKTDLIAVAVGQIKKSDVKAVYWMGAGWLGAFSMEPLDPQLLANVTGAALALEKAAALEPDYDKGAIWEILCAYYAAAPAELGGGKEKADMAYQQALRASQGKTIGPYLTYATSICIPRADSKGFDQSIEKALAINPDDDPSTRMAVTISREKALWYKEHKDDFFIIWDEE